MDGSMDHPLRPIVTTWLKKIRLAQDYKKAVFQDDADECFNFFNGPYDWLYGLKRAGQSRGFVYTGEEGEAPTPTFAMTVNKAAELVQLFGPVLYHKNPVRQVTPRKLPVIPPELIMGQGDPMDPQFMLAQQMMLQQLQQAQQMKAIDEARAILLQNYLDYTPVALNLKDESRWAIDEAIITGLGLLYTEVYQPPGAGTKLVGSFFDSERNLVIDPDMRSMTHAKWCARQCIHPVWEVEAEYGLPPGTIRGNLESYARQSEVNASVDGDYDRRRGLTNDLLCYWKVYSKMGVGARLSGVAPDLRAQLDAYGDFCFLVVCEELPYPLNLPTPVMEVPNEQDIMMRLQWPTPFWADDAWPFTPFIFHEVPGQLWPMSHLKPGLGELKFINWAYSFLAGKIKTACRDFIAVAKSAGEEMKTAIQSGKDYTLIEIEKTHGTITEVVQFLQHPNFQGDIYKVIQAVEHNFERRTGLTELMYGESAVQLRSASEASVKSDAIKIRPDDMANKVEDAMSQVARLEALAARWHLDPQDVAPIMGPLGAQWWAQYVTPADPSEILHQLEYRIEAGSIKKPNKDRDAANANQAMQTVFQPFFEYAMASGNVGPINAVITMWAKAMDMEPQPFLLAPPPPPPVPGQPPGGPGGPPEPQPQAAA